MKEVKTTLGILSDEWGYKKRQNRSYIKLLLKELKQLSLLDFKSLPDSWNKSLVIYDIELPKKNYTQVRPYNRAILFSNNGITVAQRLLSIYCYLCIKSDFTLDWKEKGFRKVYISQVRIAKVLSVSQNQISDSIKRLEKLGIIRAYRPGYDEVTGKRGNNTYYLGRFNNDYNIIINDDEIENITERIDSLKKHLRYRCNYPLYLIGEYANSIEHYLEISKNLDRHKAHGPVPWFKDRIYELIDMDVEYIKERINYLWGLKDTGRMYIFDLREENNKKIQHQMRRFIDRFGAYNPIMILDSKETLSSALQFRISRILKKPHMMKLDENALKTENISKTLGYLLKDSNRNYKQRMKTIYKHCPILYPYLGDYKTTKKDIKIYKLVSEFPGGEEEFLKGLDEDIDININTDIQFDN